MGQAAQHILSRLICLHFLPCQKPCHGFHTLPPWVSHVNYYLSKPLLFNTLHQTAKIKTGSDQVRTAPLTPYYGRFYVQVICLQDFAGMKAIRRDPTHLERRFCDLPEKKISTPPIHEICKASH
jgi:hypothetical protein